MSDISYDEAQFFEGVLEKKAHGIVGQFQKRYFRILEGKIMVYSDKKEDIEIKGVFLLDLITMPKPLDAKSFKFNLEDREFVFRTQTEEERNKWINVIKLLKNKLVEINEKQNQLRITDLDSPMALLHKKSVARRNKIQDTGKVTSEIIRKYGYVTNKEEKLSKELLKSKGIDKLLNLQDTKINRRIYYGFLYKKHKTHDYFQKRWFFIFSSRPLFENHYLDDDLDLDSKKQKDWIQFDKLYYFKYEDKNDNSENLNSLDLGNSHKIELLDKDDKYYLFLDVEDRRFDFYCDTKYERDIWFEVLKNSRRTAKEYKASLTKHPRNIELLNTYFLKGEKDFIKKMEKEKFDIVGKYEEINDYNTFEFNQENLSNYMFSTIDGCISNSPPKEDLLRGYCEYMDKAYLDICKSFWDRKYKEIENSDILKMSMKIFAFGDKLFQFHVLDGNFYKNGKEFSKIFLKKTYQNVLTIIKNLLKKEREIKAIKDENGIYCTRGPSDLLQVLFQTFDLVKNNKNRYLYELTLDLFNAAINQYLIGEEAVLNNLDIIIEKEFLLAVANNSLNLIYLVNNLLDAAKEMGVLSQEEIYESFRAHRVNNKVNKISQKAITSFALCFINELGGNYKSIPFMSLDMKKILVVTNDVFGTYKQYMNPIVIKKTWNEILKMILYHYINTLISSNYNGVTVLEIRIKIKSDTELISETFENLVGKNLTESTVKILRDIYEFLTVSSSMISSSIFTLRQYIGPSFSLKRAEAFIKLRKDFKEEETINAIKLCKDTLNKYNIDSKEDPDASSYFQIMDKEMKRQQRAKRLSYVNNENEIFIEEFIKDKKGEDDSEDEELEVARYEIDEFLKDDSDEEIEEGENKIEAPKEKDKDVIQEEVSDIIIEGILKKKTHKSYQTRFFQLKNGYLYWFKDKYSSVIQNKISLKNTIKIDSSKPKKFLIVAGLDGEKTKGIDISGKIYKFKCEDEETKNKWYTAISQEIKKLKSEDENVNVNTIEIKLRKKEIVDHFNLPEIGKELYSMKKEILKEISEENYFKPSARKIEAEKRKKFKEENERKRKELVEKMKKEEQERIEEMKKKIEETKKIQDDIKQGKSVGFADKIKLWYRTNIEGVKEEENTKKPEEKKKDNYNRMNLDDFLGEDD